MMSSMLIDNKLFDQIITQRQADRLLKGIDKLLEVLYVTDMAWDEKMNQCMSEEEVNIINSALTSQVINSEDTVKIEHFLQAIKAKIAGYKVLTLYVAVNMEKSRLEKISQWLGRQLKDKVLIDLFVDDTLLGGTVIFYEGRRGDYSISNRMEELLSEEKIREILTKGN